MRCRDIYHIYQFLIDVRLIVPGIDYSGSKLRIRLLQCGFIHDLASCGIDEYGTGLHPKEEILLRYKELGGELLTLGSDAHYPSDVGADIKRCAEILKNLGFRYYAVYRERKPGMVKL